MYLILCHTCTALLRMSLRLCHMHSLAQDVFDTLPHVQPCSWCVWYFATYVQPCSWCSWYFATCTALLRMSLILRHTCTTLLRTSLATGCWNKRTTQGHVLATFKHTWTGWEIGWKLLYLLFLIPYLWIRWSFLGYCPLKYHWPPFRNHRGCNHRSIIPCEERISGWLVQLWLSNQALHVCAERISGWLVQLWLSNQALHVCEERSVADWFSFDPLTKHSMCVRRDQWLTGSALTL